MGVQAVLYRHELWERLLRSDIPPRDWRAWLAEFRLIQRERNAGTAGVGDPEFFAQAERFMRRHDAPPAVRDVVTFYRAMTAWDFPAGAAAAERLAAGVADGPPWIEPDELLEGGVVAKLRSGDPAGARRLHAQLAPRRRSPERLRARLVDAYLSVLTNDRDW